MREYFLLKLSLKCEGSIQSCKVLFFSEKNKFINLNGPNVKHGKWENRYYNLSLMTIVSKFHVSNINLLS